MVTLHPAWQISLLEPQERLAASLAVDLGDGAEPIEIPVLAVAGARSGPRLALVAGVHGNEADGIAALYDIWNTIDPAALAGSLLIVPIANPAAFAAQIRFTPIDGGDLNRAFPGRADGTPTERLAHALTGLILPNADFLYTLHGWYATGTAAPHVEYQVGSAVSERSRAACEAVGFPFVMACDWPVGMLPAVAVAAGIPAMESEIGGQAAADRANVDYLVARVCALMDHLGMRPGAEPTRAPAHFGAGEAMTATTRGLFRARVGAGDTFRAGAHLGHIQSVSGAVVETFVAPASGVVLALRTALPVAPGDNLFVFMRLAD